MENIQVGQNIKDTIVAILNNETTSRNQKITNLQRIINNIDNLPLRILKLIDSKLK
jgi:hypothetical protein